MIVKISCLCAHLAVMIMLANPSYAIDFWSLADQSNYRCPGGVVAIGDWDRTVLEKYGGPLEMTSGTNHTSHAQRSRLSS